MQSAFEIARSLIRLDTINPPGNEARAAHSVGRLLEGAGFQVAYHVMAPDRINLIAEIKGSSDGKPLCFTGHLDTVPLGGMPWTVAPFGGETSDGKLYGRGSTDMKAGIAAMTAAAISIAKRPLKRGLKLVFTAGEETGCEGALHLAKTGVLGEAGALVVGEPSSNRPFVGHRGALWLKLVHRGRTAHGSMPELGDNAVAKAAKTITALENFGFNVKPHQCLGSPSLNIGYVHGGANVNSVPDYAEIGLDIRTIPGQSHDRVSEQISLQAGLGCQLSRLLDLQSVFSEPDDPWLAGALGSVAEVTGRPEAGSLQGAPYFTDAAVLNPAFQDPPFLILGPGEAAMAHQTDEFCVIERIGEAQEIYSRLADDWCASGTT